MLKLEQCKQNNVPLFCYIPRNNNPLVDRVLVHSYERDNQDGLFFQKVQITLQQYICEIKKTIRY